MRPFGAGASSQHALVRRLPAVVAIDVWLFYLANGEAGLTRVMAGTVESSSDPRWRKGDKVIVHPLITCGLCRACRTGDDVHCEHSDFPGIDANGGYADYLDSAATPSPAAAAYASAVNVSTRQFTGDDLPAAVRRPSAVSRSPPAMPAETLEFKAELLDAAGFVPGHRCDEATVGLDIPARRALLAHVRGLVRDEGVETNGRCTRSHW